MPPEGEPSCRRCGDCCQEHFIRYVSPEDLGRWEKERRFDILEIVRRHQADRAAETCRFLSRDGNGKQLCSIYPTRPKICRDFQPGGAKLCPQHPRRRGEGSDFANAASD